MRVRVQLSSSGWSRGMNAERAAALTLSAVLAPASLAAFTMGCWQIAAQLRWLDPLVPWNGVFSRGQVWLAAAAVLLMLVSILDRYGNRAEECEAAEW